MNPNEFNRYGEMDDPREYSLSWFIGRDDVVYILAFHKVGQYWTVHYRGPMVFPF